MVTDVWSLSQINPYSAEFIYTLQASTQRSCWGGGGGYIGFTQSVRTSVRPASHVRSVAPTVLVGSISYLYLLSSSFRRCVPCKVSCNNSKFEFFHFFSICSFDFVFFWLGIWCESLVWVIMGRWGVSQNEGVLVVLVSRNMEIYVHYLSFLKPEMMQTLPCGSC